VMMRNVNLQILAMPDIMRAAAARCEATRDARQHMSILRNAAAWHSAGLAPEPQRIVSTQPAADSRVSSR